MKATKKRFIRNFLLLNLTLILACAAFYFVVKHTRILYLPGFGCPWSEKLHIYCPGCGGSRAFFELLHGHVIHSLMCNPSVFLGGVTVMWYEIRAVMAISTGNIERYFGGDRYRVLIAFAIFVIAYALLRDVLLICFKIDLLGDLRKFYI